jgi:hypothetical protein
MPKYEVHILDTYERVYDVEAVNDGRSRKLVKEMDSAAASRTSLKDRRSRKLKRKLEPKERVFQMQIMNIRADYERLATKQSLADGTIVDDATAETMKVHLATLHDALVDQSGLDIPSLGEEHHLDATNKLIAEHLGDDTIPAKKTPVHIENPEEVWKRCATAFGWEFDEDYKGWIKPANIKEGKRRGEWDAFVRDMTAEDACNEEGIDSVEEAAEALS